MPNIDDNVVPVLYALMAIEQDVTTSELAVGAQNRSMPEADTESDKCTRFPLARAHFFR